MPCATPLSGRAADTSVIVAAFARWHEYHDVAWHALDRTDAFLAPCFVETYSVLTRLPPPHKVAPEIAASYLDDAASGSLVGLAPRRLKPLVRLGVAGGAIYDAVVAATAKDAGLTLVTLDRRAVPTYERVGVGYALLDV